MARIDGFGRWERDGSRIVGWRLAAGSGGLIGDEILVLRPGDEGYDDADAILRERERVEAEAAAAGPDPAVLAAWRESLRHERDAQGI